MPLQRNSSIKFIIDTKLGKSASKVWGMSGLREA
jgi:hypothetical protein